MPGCCLHFAADHIGNPQFAASRIKSIYVHMVHSLVRHQQIFIVMSHSGTIDMRTKIPFRQAAHALVIHFVSDTADRAVLLDLQHGQFAVMVTGNKEVLVRVVRGQITASHPVDGSKIQQFQAAVLHNGVCLHAKIRNGIQAFPIVRDCHIGRVGNFHLILFREPPLFHIHIINSDTMAIPHCIGGYIRNIFVLRHSHIPPQVISVTELYPNYSTKPPKRQGKSPTV